MSDYIDKQNEIFEEIQKVFVNAKNELKSAQKDLQKDFEEILLLHAQKYKLVSTSDYSVNPTAYYGVKSRVKSPHSFKEKLYRKNLGLQISLKHDLTITTFSEKHPEVKKSILLLDDIIGTRIVTELKHDCKNAYELVKNESHFFEDRDIIFFKEELNEQPEYMKNGLPIFRIKGIYKKIYGFELQIKSKIDEAWGDMDHSIFYKDYSVSPIKNTVQTTMNNIGHLFDKVEDLLFGLRNSESNYQEKKEEIDFLYKLSGSAFIEIKKKLGDNYDLSNIASSIKYIQNQTKIENKDIEVKDLKFDFLTYSSDEEEVSKYIQNRNANFELIILESLYWYWMEKGEIKRKIDDGNYIVEIKIYINILTDNLSINVSSISKLEFIDVDKTKIKKFINIASFSESKKSIYIDPKSIYQLLITDVLLSEAISEYTQEEELEINDITEDIKDIYLYKYFNLDITATTGAIIRKKPEIIELNNLNDIIYNVNNKIRNQLNIYRISEDFATLREVKFLEKLSSNVLENIKSLSQEI